MNIFLTHNISFRAHTYKIRPKSESLTIQTDNDKDFGKEAYLVLQKPQPSSLAMAESEGGGHLKEIYAFSPIIKYHIEYKDTKKSDLKNGADYEINYKKMAQDASLYLRKQHKQPIIHTIKSGKTSGKLVYKEYILTDESESLKEINEPSIILTSSLLGLPSNSNIVGVIFTNDDAGSLCHLSSQLRNTTEICGCIFDPEIISKLESLDGENVEIELNEEAIKFNKTNKLPKLKHYPKINVSKLNYCNKPLTSKEYSSDVIGAKACKLRYLEELAQDGKISAIIPKSIALPYGYIDGLMAKSSCLFAHYDKDSKELNDELENLKQFLKNNGVTGEYLMIRSAFNAEDLKNYSAAGMYSSYCAYMKNLDATEANKELYDRIRNVKMSKRSKYAIEQRKRFQIPEENIQCGVIIQPFIDQDYKFTIYTDDGFGRMKIELFSDKRWENENYNNPHVFTYDKNLKKLTYDSIQMGNCSVTFDENMKIVDSDYVQYDLSDDKTLFKLLEVVVQDALTVEKEFGAFQDIEGGLKDGDIYFWQSRNIVK